MAINFIVYDIELKKTTTLFDDSPLLEIAQNLSDVQKIYALELFTHTLPHIINDVLPKMTDKEVVHATFHHLVNDYNTLDADEFVKTFGYEIRQID